MPALGYSWLTSLYDPLVRLTTRERRFKHALIHQAALAPGMEVLDLGCGTGTLALWLKQVHTGARVVGLDGDERILAIARAKATRAGSDIRFDQGLSTALPYEDGRFDRVFSTLFFHHLVTEDKRRTLGESHRVLKPGGELHVADWGKPAGPLMRLLFLGIQLLDGFITTRDNVQGRLPALFAEAGFQDVAVRGEINTVFGTISLYRARKAGVP